jgi:folate-binding protein YgfZ
MMAEATGAAGYESLRERAAWLDLSSRGKIVATGEDRARLLHAMTTNHIKQLTPGDGCYALFLTAQGKIVSDVNLLCLEDRFLLDTEPETRERLHQHLDKYIIADDVTLENQNDGMATIAVEGPTAVDLLHSIDAPTPEKRYSHQAWQGGLIQNVSFTGAAGFRMFLPKAQIPELIGQLQSAGIRAADTEAARIVRLEHFKPRYGDDIFDTTLPHESQLLHALHFSKGCYLGQEVVERVRSRGLVHRLLVGLYIDANHPPAPGTDVLAAGNPIGKLGSAAFSPALNEVVAMAYVRREFAAPKTPVSVEEHPAEVRAIWEG